MHFKPRHKSFIKGLILSCMLLSVGVSYAGDVTYTYDDANRLIRATADGVGIEYVYDAVGNLQQRLTTYSLLTITTSTGANGSIAPLGPVAVPYGNNQTFTIAPDRGYYVTNVQVDGSSVGAVTAYTFSNVTASHAVSASFASFPVKRVSGTDATYYLTIQAAYNAATAGDSIEIRGLPLSENLMCGSNVNVALQGGYDATFSSQTGYTSVGGQLILRGGTVRARNLLIKAP